MHRGIYPPIRYRAELSPYHKNPLCANDSSRPILQPLATTDIFITSMVLPIQDAIQSEMTQYAAFLDGLLSFSNMHFQVPLYFFMG